MHAGFLDSVSIVFGLEFCDQQRYLRIWHWFSVVIFAHSEVVKNIKWQSKSLTGFWKYKEKSLKWLLHSTYYNKHKIDL